MTDSEDLAGFVSACLNLALSDAGIDSALAHSIARSVEDDVRREYGGDRHYVRLTSKERKRQRNKSIIRAWKEGLGREEIAQNYDVDRRTVDRVIGAHLNKQTQRCTGFGRDEWVL